MTWAALNFQPGIDKDNSSLEAGRRGRFTDADKVRFVDALPQSLPGVEKVTSTLLTGIARGAYAWADNSRNPWAGFGTHLRLYAMDLDGTVTDITPVSSYDQQSISFTTTLSSDTVTITGWTHGLAVSQKFLFENATVTTVGGVTINGTYTVLTVESTTSITFTAAQVASSAAGPTASRVDITNYLAPGNLDGLGGSGYGSGGYGSGTYGGSNSLTLFPRTWSEAQWGQNLLASPRGAGIYEWAPNTTSTELLGNTKFTAGANWSAGTGWAAGAAGMNASAGVASNLTQYLTIGPACYNLVTLNLSVVAGTIQPYLGALTIGSAISATGLYRVEFFSDAGTQLLLTKDATFQGTIINASVKVLATGSLLPHAPTQVGSVFVTAERIVVACGSNLNATGTGTTTFDPLQIDWSDAENNQTWAPASSNLAGGDQIPSGGRVVRGLPGPRENMVWTQEGAWAMRYNGDTKKVYDFTELGQGCGLMGPNAAALVGGVWYWMTPQGAFFAYDGSTPQQLPCTLARDVRDNFAWVQGDKVYATRVIGPNFIEVWWFYPDSRDGAECSRYVTFSISETRMSGVPVWSCGTFNRTAYVDAAAFQYPMAVDTSGQIWFHEKGNSLDGGPWSSSLTGAYQSGQKGQICIDGVRPDTDDLQGGYTITYSSKIRSTKGISTRTYSALSINSTTGQKNVCVKGEQVAFTIAANSSPSFWRLGAMQVDVTITGATH